MKDIIEFKFISQIKKDIKFQPRNIFGEAFISICLLLTAFYITLIGYQSKNIFLAIPTIILSFLAALFIYSIYCEIIVKITLAPDTITFTMKDAVLGFAKKKLQYKEITKAMFTKNTMKLLVPKNYWDTVYIDGLSPSDLALIKNRLIKMKVQIVPFKISKKKFPSDIIKR